MSMGTAHSQLWKPVALRQRFLPSARQAGAIFGAWILVGLAVGFLGRETVGPGMVAMISNMIAGAIVLPVLGLPTVFFGARAVDALLGSTTGGIAFYLTGSLGTEPLTGQFLCLGVIMGAIMASTGWPIVRKMVGFIQKRWRPAFRRNP